MLLVKLSLEFFVALRIGIIVGQGIVMLTQGVDPTWLVATGKAGKGTAFGHLVENGDIFGNPKGILTRQYESQLTQADVLGLHAEIHVEQNGVGRNLFSLNMEVVLGEANAIIAVCVEILGLLSKIAQHTLIQIGPPTGHTFLKFRLIANGGKIENAKFHTLLLVVTNSQRLLILCQSLPDFGRAER